MPLPTPTERLAADLKADAIELKKEFEIYNIRRLEAASMIDDVSTKRALEHQICTAPIGEVPALREKLAQIAGPGAESHRQNLISAARRQWPMVSTVALLKKAGLCLEVYRAEYIESETNFFGAYGLPRQATSVSKQADTLLAHVRQYLADLQSPAFAHGPMLPPATHPLLELIGYGAE